MGYAVATAVPVTALALLGRDRVDAVVDLDREAIAAATEIARAHPGLHAALVGWQEALQPVWVYVVGTGVCGWLWWGRHLKSQAIWGFVTMMVSWNLALDLKYVVRRARPVLVDPVSSAPGYSFPSGHAANSAAAGTVVVIMVWPLLTTTRAKVAACGIAGAVVLITALDRVFLGVHFPSDVAAGVLMGSGLALASYAGYRGWNPAHPTRGSAERPEENPSPWPS